MTEHTFTHTHMHTHTDTHRYTHAHAHTQRHTHRYTHTQVHTHTHFKGVPEVHLFYYSSPKQNTLVNFSIFKTKKAKTFCLLPIIHSE